MKIDMDAIVRVTETWDQTEGLVKRSEILSEAMAVPAISELRYAGRKLIDYLRALVTGASQESLEMHLAEFEQNVFRARHDALDGIIITIREVITLQELRSGIKVITKILPWYPEFRETITEIEGKIIYSRSHRLERADTYGDIIKAYNIDDILTKFAELRSSEALLSIERDSYSRNLRITRYSVLFGILMAVITLSVIIIK